MVATRDRIGFVLHVADLYTTLHTTNGDVRAVDGVSFDVAAGEAVGVVGESGSGKTMILRSIVGAFALADVTRSGTIDVGDVDMLRSPDAEVLRTLGTKIGMVSQNPLTALNPVRRIETQIIEPMIVHAIGDSKDDRRERAAALLKRCGVSPDAMQRRPHEFSGGQRQRIVIARALTLSPSLLICDEPTSALDVSVQSQILNLLKDLQRDLGLSMLFISHDMAVIRHMCDRVAVMRGGSIVEIGDRDDVIESLRAEYTKRLLEAVPSVD